MVAAHVTNVLVVGLSVPWTPLTKNIDLGGQGKV